jgi:hypothetical protein
LVAIFISAAICQSVIALGISPGYQDYWPHLWQRLAVLRSQSAKPGGLNPQERKEMEQLLWANNELTEAEKMISADWDAARPKANNAPAPFREKALQHASILMDQCGYSSAIEDYKTILERDRYYNPGKINIGVDLNNIGVAYQMLAISTNEPKARTEYSTKSLENYRLAENEFSKLKNDDALFHNLANQYALLQEMHDKKQARDIFAKLQKVDTQPTKDFREMVLEQQ